MPRKSASAWSTALLTAVGPCVWGTTYLVTTELLPPQRPLFAALARALPAGLIALVLGRTLPRGVWWWRSAILGLLNIGLFFPLLFLSAYRLPGGVAATVGAVSPLLVALIAIGLLGEHPNRWRLLWGVAAVGGVGLMVLRRDAGFDALGLLAALGGVASMATGTVLVKRWGLPEGVGPVSLTGWQLTAGGLVLLPITLAVEGPPPVLDGGAWVGLLWLGLIGGLLAYILWFRGLGRLPVGAASFLPLLSPVVATLLGWSVLGQALTAVQLLGFLIALVAVSAAQYAGPPRPRSLAGPGAATAVHGDDQHDRHDGMQAEQDAHRGNAGRPQWAQGGDQGDRHREDGPDRQRLGGHALQ
ncbi:EamA family transporter [Propionibacteriaceae bacterium Y1685]